MSTATTVVTSEQTQSTVHVCGGGCCCMLVLIATIIMLVEGVVMIEDKDYGSHSAGVVLVVTASLFLGCFLCVAIGIVCAMCGYVKLLIGKKQ